MIRTETRELYLVQRSPDSFREHWCSDCGTMSDFLGIDHAVNLFGIAVLELLNGVRMFEIHSTEIEHGRLIICQSSLINYIVSADPMRKNQELSK